jgi:RecA-family ATPase
MKKIFLTQNQVALVDDENYEYLSQWKWCANKRGKIFYAIRNSLTENGKKHIIYMHHEILGKSSNNKVTDHINGVGTDNQKKNLRWVTCRQNTQSKKNINKSSKYPGVSWGSRAKKWQTAIRISGKKKWIGYFINEKEAFDAYRQVVESLGETVIKDV